ncbi:unnamed protein product [Prorocentrum cordatum]|uniref:Uncharacterized protein n=1 Tax=Prorocentrum cordatum TaxID=2364126 RepID=A0ABN9WNU1_9DINO|nr:unnamed protein product [Polarella glacialis]
MSRDLVDAGALPMPTQLHRTSLVVPLVPAVRVQLLASCAPAAIAKGEEVPTVRAASTQILPGRSDAVGRWGRIEVRWVSVGLAWGSWQLEFQRTSGVTSRCVGSRASLLSTSARAGGSKPRCRWRKLCEGARKPDGISGFGFVTEERALEVEAFVRCASPGRGVGRSAQADAEAFWKGKEVYTAVQKALAQTIEKIRSDAKFLERAAGPEVPGRTQMQSLLRQGADQVRHQTIREACQPQGAPPLPLAALVRRDGPALESLDALLAGARRAAAAASPPPLARARLASLLDLRGEHAEALSVLDGAGGGEASRQPEERAAAALLREMASRHARLASQRELRLCQPRASGGAARPSAVEVLDAATASTAEVAERFVGPGRPCVLRGCEAVPRWTPEELAGRLGALAVPLRRLDGSSASWARLELVGSAPFGDFVRQHVLKPQGATAGAKPRETPQVFDFSIWQQCADVLADEVAIPKWFATDLFSLASARMQPVTGSASPTLFLAAGGTASGLHVDFLQTHFWMGLCSGRKRWRLVPPEDLALLRPTYLADLNPAFPADLDDEAPAELARGGQLSVLEHVLEPGRSSQPASLEAFEHRTSRPSQPGNVSAVPSPTEMSPSADAAAKMNFAACEGENAVIEKLVAKGVSVNLSDYDRRTPLHIAAAEGNLSTVQMLISANADVAATDRWGHTPMDGAAGNNFEDIMAALRTAGGEHGLTPRGRKEPDHTPAVTAQTGVGEPSSDSSNAECLMLSSLMSTPRLGGAKAELRADAAGMRLCCAAAAGDARVLFRLIADGVHVDAKDYDGRTALHIAAAYGHQDIVQGLLDLGADARHKDNFGNTPLSSAVGHQQEEVAAVLMKALQQRRGGWRDEHPAEDIGLDLPGQVEGKFARQTSSGWMIEEREVKLGPVISKTLKSAIHTAEWRGIKVVAKTLLKKSSHESAWQADDGDITKEVLREIGILSTMRHPDLVMFLGACIDSAQPFLISEFMEGGDLDRGLQHEGLPAGLSIQARDEPFPQLVERGCEGAVFPPQLFLSDHPQGPQAPQPAPHQEQRPEGYRLRHQQTHEAEPQGPDGGPGTADVRRRGHMALHGAGGGACGAVHRQGRHLLIRADHVVHGHRVAALRGPVRAGRGARPEGLPPGQRAAPGLRRRGPAGREQGRARSAAAAGAGLLAQKCGVAPLGAPVHRAPCGGRHPVRAELLGGARRQGRGHAEIGARGHRALAC